MNLAQEVYVFHLAFSGYAALWSIYYICWWLSSIDCCAAQLCWLLLRKHRLMLLSEGACSTAGT
jgi:hypothetical protein